MADEEKEESRDNPDDANVRVEAALGIGKPSDAELRDRAMRRRWMIVGTAIGMAAVIAGGTAALLLNIHARKDEARSPFFRVVELTDETEDPATWGMNFPFQYDGYKRTVDMERTRFGGSEAMPRMKTAGDPRTVVAQSRLDEDPRLRTMWSGYAFAHDFREDRGHAYMLDDQTFTERQVAAKQPGACLSCHASVYLAYRRLGGGDLEAGFAKLNPMAYPDARKHVERAVACIDCHDPFTMQLRITRPAFVEGIRALKAGQGMPDYDPNTMASRQEMRSFVCAQCHVEYYFQGPEKRLVYPWAKGLRVDDIYAYYDEQQHSDWVHAETGAPLLKAQHPEFEMWSQGIHARSGVACADCHMPYTRVGATKISDHHVRSPVLNIDRACRTCHHFDDAELKARVEGLQERVFGLRNRALDALVDLIRDLATARAAGWTDAALDRPRALQRQAQFYLDFVEAENSVGFHAAEEAERILAEAIDLARQGQLALRGGIGTTAEHP